MIGPLEEINGKDLLELYGIVSQPRQDQSSV